MDKSLMYLDTYVIQHDMRFRLPKSIITNMNVEKGVSKLDIYLDPNRNELVLKIHKESIEREWDL